jgi:hypothetical protein
VGNHVIKPNSQRLVRFKLKSDKPVEFESGSVGYFEKIRA